MTTPIPTNPVKESSTVVTRLRKRRDLETTMNTLKQLLEPTLAIATRAGSRKKNKPRSLAKKVVAPKKVNPFENCSEGEYYPNKMKRKVRLKKTILKPRHELKMVMATNKRKRSTPHKGLESLNEETPTYKLITQPLDILHTEPTNCAILNVHTECNIKGKTDYLKVDTELMLHTPLASNRDKYELISPPHRSLTEMTVDDLIRMDEDSLSDENLMEILTCPSPVWWEDPDACTGSLFITRGADTSTTNISNDAKHDTNTHINKGKKIAKLESILGHIKSLARSDITFVNNDPANDGDNVPDTSVVTDSILKIREEGYADEKKVKEIRTCELDITKRRTISSSGSEISVNEDDLLKNLEGINIPIQEQKVDGDVNDIKIKIVENFVDVNNHEIIPIFDRETPPCDDVEKESSEVNESDEIDSNILDRTLKHPERYRKKYSNKNKESKSHTDSIKDTHKSKNKEEGNDFESVSKSILKRLKKQSDDILDVQLIKKPTNVTNQVQVWSKLNNFKPHNFKPEDFVSEVIDIEDELDFSLIESSPKNSLKSKNETILIDDDSNEQLDVNTMLKVNDTINIDSIEQCSDVTIATIFENGEIYQSCEIIEMDHSKEALVGGKDTVKEDTIIADSDADLRIVKTASTLEEASIKPKGKRKKAAASKQLRKNQIKNVKKKKRSIEDVRILPMKTVDIAPPPPLTSCPAEISYQYLNKHRSQCTIERVVENSSIAEVLDTADANDTILCLDDVDVSLVKNPVSKKDIVKINQNKLNQNDLSITLLETIPMTTKNSTEAVLESPFSVKNVDTDSFVDYPEGAISDMSIQFVDEYQDNKSKGENLEINSQRTSEERDIELRKDLIIVKHLADDNNVLTNMELHGNNSGLEDLEEGDKTIEIKYLDEENIESVGDEGNKDADDIHEVQMIERDNLEEIQVDKVTQNFNEEIQMVGHSLEDTVDNKTKVNLYEDKIIELNSHDNDGDQNKNKNTEEFVTIYQIVGSNLQIENVEANKLMCIEEG